jgi:opacity protein-like surface antigen
MKTCCGLVMVAVLLLVPSRASAEWFVFPFAAVNTGGDTTKDSAAFGISGGWMGRWIGLEAEAATSPSFFDSDEGFRETHKHTTYGGSALVGPRIGNLRPYAAIGASLLRSEIEEVGGLASVNDERGALHVGGGAMWDVARHVGVRGEARYIRSFDEEEPEGNVFEERFARLAYWRIGGGVTVRW